MHVAENFYILISFENPFVISCLNMAEHYSLTVQHPSSEVKPGVRVNGGICPTLLVTSLTLYMGWSHGDVAWWPNGIGVLPSWHNSPCNILSEVNL